MAKVNTETIKELEAKLRQGDYSSIQAFLRQVSRHEIPERLILPLSQLARRIDYAKKGIILLRDRVIELPPGQRADSREQAEYAACLLKLGGVDEARWLLQQIPEGDNPETLKYLAFSYVHQWDYEKAIPFLKKYLARAELGAYDRLVGSVNLSAALIEVDQLNEAMELMTTLMEQARQGGHQLLSGNICELMTQVCLHMGEFGRATHYMELSWQALKAGHPRYRLYIQKWQAVAGLLENPTDEAALVKLNAVRSEGVVRGEWELVRACDYYESTVRKNTEIFTHLYFGTPYAPFRAKMLRNFGAKFTLPETYIWGERDRQILDLETGQDEQRRAVLKKNQSLHRTAKALAFDFYAPARVAQLFHHIFENEKFHPESAPHRVYELVRRLKAIMQNSGFPLVVKPTTHGYKMDVLKSHLAWRTRAQRGGRGLLSEAHALFGDSAFRLRDLSTRMGTPHTTVYRELKRLVSSGDVQVIGDGKHTHYKVKSRAA